jgi:S-(hydroxymethyl)glutathione dehydrogenase/alcohol dehydrogenase
MVMEHHSGEKRVLVVGGGGVGIFTVLALMHQGVGAIHVVEPSKEKRKMISSLSEIVVTYDSLEEDRLRKEVEDEGEFREVFVCTSSSSALQESLSLLAAPGLLVFCTHPKKGELLRLDPFDLIRGKVILGSWGGGCKNGLIRQQVIDFYIKAVDRLEGLISKPLGIDEINEAVKLAKRNSHMRVMIRMQK